ncbi:MAG: Por secretion system protein [Bacteroidaceae bacterium]|nr:Por secretion system protein [Bacteroidaceae bacterium]
MAVGEWRGHFAYHNATQCATLGDKVFAISDGSLFSYTPSDTYIDIYNKSTLLSDQGIRYLERCDSENLLLIVYDNANIDLLYPDESIVNLPDYYQKSTFDPDVKDVTISGSYAYLTTPFGIVVVNLKKREFSNTYRLGDDVISCSGNKDYIMASTIRGLFIGKTSDNLLDPANWHLLNDIYFEKIVCFDGKFYGLRPSKGIYNITPTNTITPLIEGTFSDMKISDGNLYSQNGTTYSVFSKPDNTSVETFTLPSEASDITFKDNLLWAASGSKGLIGYKKDGATLSEEVIGIIPDSPIRNHCDYIQFTPDERLLIAGGCLDYFGTTSYPGTAEMLTDEGWTIFQEEGLSEATGLKYGYRNATCIVEDPTDAKHHYVASFGQGIYEFQDGMYVSNINSSNSSLETALEGKPHYTRISRLKFDADGNLWITNSHAISPLKVLKKDGTLIDLYYDELKQQETVTDILFDSNGWTWVVVMRTETGLFCIDDNGTPFNTSDDKTRFISSRFVDQDGYATTLDYINDIAEDHNGIIWVLTNQGPFIIENPKQYFEPDFHFVKIKVPRNDGTNFADYLLDAVYTTCIAIDDANRKWIGTQGAGLYLISADGMETVHHFTSTNSPLPSDNIKDIAIKGSTGEVFVATDAGLVSYRSDATRGAEGDFNKSDVYAFPNPVSPDYEGLVTIVGLKADSDVRILSTDGHLICHGTSLGGSFTWNLRDHTGHRVPTGVYFVVATDAEGRKGVITKVTVIK